MRAKQLTDLLKKGDRVAVSNITGREASKVSLESQCYSDIVVGGWALGKGGRKLETAVGEIPVFSDFQELMELLPDDKKPNKIIIYSPPEAVYGEVKEVVQHGKDVVETIFIITEHVSIEVTAKIHHICAENNIDVIGCNTLGMINVHDHVRVGAVGGDTCEDTFKPGSVTVISNSGNMVNTISSYLQASGMGIAYGLSTGKDMLILTPVKEFLILTQKDPRTKLIVLYAEPGGVYESEAIQIMRETGFNKPLVVYISGRIAEKYSLSLGHAGAVVEGKKTSATGKMEEFDGYFGIEPFDPDKKYENTLEVINALRRGIRVNALHDLPKAVSLVADMLNIEQDLPEKKQLTLNPWFINLGKFAKQIPAELVLKPGEIPEPYASNFGDLIDAKLGGDVSRIDMRNASHASANDGVTPRIYGYSLMDLMRKHSFAAAVVLYWTGELPESEFEERLAEMTLIASLTNGPGTISAQGAKLSASAGNSPNTAMIGTLASIGNVHGGNGGEAARFLISIFENYNIKDPYDLAVDVRSIALEYAADYKSLKDAAKKASKEYPKIPCLGHPVFKNDPINYDPRERVIYNFLKENGKTNIFLEFYHSLVRALKENGVMNKILAVNVDAALACIWLGICWRHLYEKRMTVQRATELPFAAFALGRVAGGAGEYLDHTDYGKEMDMRVPTKECISLTKPRNIE